MCLQFLSLELAFNANVLCLIVFRLSRVMLQMCCCYVSRLSSVMKGRVHLGDCRSYSVEFSEVIALR